MTNEATRLAACPFCEGVCAVTKGYSSSELPWSGDGGDFFRVYCSKCQSRQLFHRTQAEAVEAWNRRATLAQPAVSEDAPEFTHEPALCIKPACPPNCCGCNHAISGQEQRDYAIRYALLRRKVCIIGAFGKDAAFHILNLDPVADWKNDAASTILDKAIDAAMASQEKPHD